MADEPTTQTPEQQVPETPGQQAPVTPPTTPAVQTPNPQEDWKTRFDGAIQKIEQLTITNRSLQADLATKTSEIEQLKQQLSQGDIEKTVAVGERDKRLQELLTTNQTLESENASLKALRLKLEVAKELNRPDLVAILDNVPNLTDKEALTNVMSTFSNWADNLVQQREQQLSIGITPPVSAHQTPPQKPSTSEGWQRHINSLPVGSQERQTALNEWLAFEQTKK
jgi:hypothetical protein